MRRGELWVARLNPNQGAETGKLRPVMILTADALIATGIPVLLIIPATTRLLPGTEPLRTFIPARDRLLSNSYLMLEQLRTLDRSRFGDGPLTSLTAREMTAVEKGLKAVMGMSG